MSHSGLPGRECLVGLDRSELMMSNKIGSLVFSGYLDQGICLKGANEERTIASVAGLDTRLYLMVASMSEKHTVELVDKSKGVQKKHHGALS